MYTAPSALPSTSLPSARRAIAVKSVSAVVDLDAADGARVQVDDEVAAAGRQVGRPSAVAGQRGRRPRQRDDPRRPPGARRTRPDWRRRLRHRRRGSAPTSCADAASNTAAAGAARQWRTAPAGVCDGRR